MKAKPLDKLVRNLEIIEYHINYYLNMESKDIESNKKEYYLLISLRNRISETVEYCKTNRGAK